MAFYPLSSLQAPGLAPRPHGRRLPVILRTSFLYLGILGYQRFHTLVPAGSVCVNPLCSLYLVVPLSPPPRPIMNSSPPFPLPARPSPDTMHLMVPLGLIVAIPLSRHALKNVPISPRYVACSSSLVLLGTPLAPPSHLLLPPPLSHSPTKAPPLSPYDSTKHGIFLSLVFSGLAHAGFIMSRDSSV